MIIYTVYDGSEIDCAFPTKREALEYVKDMEHYWVHRIDLGRITKNVLCRLYEHEGYAVKSDVILERR